MGEGRGNVEELGINLTLWRKPAMEERRAVSPHKLSIILPLPESPFAALRYRPGKNLK